MDAQPIRSPGPVPEGSAAGDDAPAGTVVAVRAGPVRRQHWCGREVATAAVKHLLAGPVPLGVLGLPGDEQGDRRHHGGPDKALLAYAREDYAAWWTEGREIPEGGFSENLTVTGWPGARVHAGDVFAIGEALVQVTQPRRPCRTLSDRWGMPDLVAEVQRTGRAGYYLRVLREGRIGAGDAMALVDRPGGSVSVAEIHRVMNVDRGDRVGIARVLASPELPAPWRAQLRRRLAGAPGDAPGAEA
ncbi:MOSC domain-containing protein [Citricoccus sp. SGAir0253]|uniref:MOSC domain-containing protein n=1 Tax=Citricoccus sp. SGAir0253 TaxID=2567881 RepID=UPI0010CCE1B2|nr:MOSC domain-containing protein [Citricoccus sp. SGAir0253]QCU78207.1 MOSC domain-containing protein [Citricoccus sp. SGAir0253]